MIFQHHVLLPSRAAGSTRADSVTSTRVKGALLDEHYLEHEARHRSC